MLKILEFKILLNKMTIYQIETPFEYKKQKEFTCSSVDKRSESCVRVCMCINECLKHHLGHDSNNYGYSSQKWKDIVNEGNVYGTYIHGIFDAPDVAKQIVATLLQEKGCDPEGVKAFEMKEYKEKQYDALADVIRASLDMERVYDIVEKGSMV